MAELTKVTLYLVPAAADAVEQAARATGLSGQDVMNRAVQLYWWLVELRAAGSRILAERQLGPFTVEQQEVEWDRADWRPEP